MAYWTYTILAACLIAAVYWDLTRRRVPNLLVMTMVLSGFTIRYAAGSWPEVLLGTTGLVVGFAMLLPFYAKGGMGAGDVKLMAAIGLFLGPGTTALAVLYTLIFGGLFAASIVAIQRCGPQRAVLDRDIPYVPAVAAGVAAALTQTL